MTGPRRLDPDDLAPGDLFDHLEPLDTRCARAHTRDMTTTQTTALTIAGTPVVDLAVEWGRVRSLGNSQPQAHDLDGGGAVTADLRALPAPSAAAGSTRCPGCGHLFTADQRPMTTITGSESRGRRGYSASGPGVHNAHPVAVRWHVDCLSDHHRANVALREQARLDRRDMVRTIAQASDMDVAAVLAEFDAQNPEVTE